MPAPRRAVLLLVAWLLLAAACAAPGTGPELRIMVPNVAGGGYDVTARTAAAIAQRTGVAPGPITVFNLDGDGGTVALRRLLAERGNADLVMMMGLGVVGATASRPGADQVTAATPIARLLEESQAVLVPADSPYRDIGALIAAWRADPAAITVGGGSAVGGPDHLTCMGLAHAAGIDPARVHYQPFDGGGQLLPPLLDGRIDVALSSVTEYTAQVHSGQLRVLAVSGTARPAGVDAPTFTEAGFGLVFANWRGVLAPPGISPADRDRLVSLLRQIEQTPEWNSAMQRAGWTNAFLPADQFATFLTNQDIEVRATLARLGLP